MRSARSLRKVRRYRCDCIRSCTWAKSYLIGTPHDITVFLAVKNWLDDVANNLDQLTYDTFTDDRDFWEELPVVVEFLLRRV